MVVCRLRRGRTARSSRASPPATRCRIPTPAACRASTECINGWRGLSPLALNPLYGSAPNQQNFEPLSAIAATEWTHFGDIVNIVGRGADGYARRYWDNVGVQYGLQAVATGQITPAEFLKLNAVVGGWKEQPAMVQEGLPVLSRPRLLRPGELGPVERAQPGVQHRRRCPRRATQGDIEAMRAVYRSGLVFMGDIDIPVIDWRNYLEDELDMHNSHQSFASRKRMLNADGDAYNQVIWFTDVVVSDQRFDQTPEALEVMDEWMRTSSRTRRAAWRPTSRRARSTAASTTPGPEIAAARTSGTASSTPNAAGRLHAAVQDVQHAAARGGRPVRAEPLQVPARSRGRGGRPAASTARGRRAPLTWERSWPSSRRGCATTAGPTRGCRLAGRVSLGVTGTPAGAFGRPPSAAPAWGATGRGTTRGTAEGLSRVVRAGSKVGRPAPVGPASMPPRLLQAGDRVDQEGQAAGARRADRVDEVRGERLQPKGRRAEGDGVGAGELQRGLPLAGLNWSHGLLAVGEAGHADGRRRGS